MKANEAPEKIYVPQNDTLESGLEDFWVDHQVFGNEIGYIRTDAFMKKAKEAFCKATCNGHPPRSTCTSLGTCKGYDDFVKYMKGE